MYSNLVRVKGVVKKVSATGEMTNLTPDEAMEARLLGCYCPCEGDILKTAEAQNETIED